jgi:hypothetical protein
MINDIITSLGMAIPSGLTDDGWLRKFEERLTDFSRLWGFVKSTKVEEIIKEQDCIELFERVRSIETDVQGRINLSKGEMWSLKFLKGINESDFIAFIKMVGPLHYMVRIASDIEKKGDDLTNNLRAALFIYLFQNLYELLLENIDSCFYVYLDRKDEVKGQKNINNYRQRFIVDRKEARKIKEDKGEHATAGMIHGMLKEVYKEECDNNQTSEDLTLLDDTIFNQMAKKFRNASAHFNAFYDENRNRIVFLNGEEMTMNEFTSLYDKLFLFLTQWMNLYLSEAKDSKAFANKIKEEMVKMLSRTERRLHEIERSGKRGAWNILVLKLWGNSIVKFEKNDTVDNSNRV